MRFRFVMFDWGDTIMKDVPSLKFPMYQWPEVELIEGAEEALRSLHIKATLAIATGATQSDEADIRQALKRVKVDRYFDHIFCFKNTGFQKPSEEFYQYSLRRLDAKPSEVAMVGDSFANDVLAANQVGIFGIWLNQKGLEDMVGEQYKTIHSLGELSSILMINQ